MDSLISIRLEVCGFHYGPSHCTGILAVPIPGVYRAWEFVASQISKNEPYKHGCDVCSSRCCGISIVTVIDSSDCNFEYPLPLSSYTL